MENREKSLEKIKASQTTIGVISGLARAVRMIVQAGVMGVGVWLVLNTQDYLAGAIIAGSILLGRALAPIDQSISLWRPFVAARQAATRLSAVVDAVAILPETVDVPAPEAKLRAANLTLAFRSQPRPIMASVSFVLDPGSVLGVFGPNSAGKTTFLRAVAGIHIPARGTISLGSTPVSNYSEDDRTTFIGYMPQDAQLLPGTIGQNVSRFSAYDKNAMFKALDAAGATAFVQQLPDGIQTVLQPGMLSSGQAQLISMARAIYRDPPLLIMDEPSSNLDTTGKVALVKIIRARQKEKLVTAFATHEDGLLKLSSHLMQFHPNNEPGRVRVGPIEQISKLVKAEREKRRPKRIAHEQGNAKNAIFLGPFGFGCRHYCSHWFCRVSLLVHDGTLGKGHYGFWYLGCSGSTANCSAFGRVLSGLDL